MRYIALKKSIIDDAVEMRLSKLWEWKSRNDESNCFDALTAGFGVRNFQDLEKGLRESFRVLNNEGILSKREVQLLRYEKDKALISDGFANGDKILLTRLDVLVEGMKLEKKDQTK